MVVSLLVKNHDPRATLFGAHAYVGWPATSVLTKAQFGDGRHNGERALARDASRSIIFAS
jgi:hypothetical protein